ncbi:hypothetical protein ACFQMA_21915 [Halosimplex aquaticum]|uniref:Uncharacterized protein n=1 Tax=Halosimplex aquaticum TaxID=3026162 RepID=A0ABD5Y9V4_9EURY|nr:hypothetical protein [Halosimplex aquaticum]
MSWSRRIWVVLAVIAVLGASAAILASLYGDGAVAVEDVTVTGATPTNTTANCENVVVRSASVSATVSRPGASVDNQQFWAVGVAVRASVFGETKRRVVSVPPGSSRTVTVPFTSVREGSWAPQSFEDVVIQVSQGSATVAERTKTVTLVPVKAGQDC